MTLFVEKLLNNNRLASTLAVVCAVLFAAWLGNTNGGYFIGAWAPVALMLAALMMIASAAGLLRWTASRWSVVALAFFILYAAWTFLSISWSANQGDAWLGGAQTLLYLLVFWLSVGLVALDASRRWALLASSLGPAVIAALTLAALAPGSEALFEKARLIGTVGYYNGEAAFLLVPFWASVYLAGSWLIHPVLRALVLSGAVLSVELAVLTQSRGAMVALAVSLPVFFLLSGHKLRALLALAPVAVALLVAFPGLNEVYLDLRDQGSAEAAIGNALPLVWASAAGAGIYGLVWSLVDGRWSPPVWAARAAGGIALVSAVTVAVAGGLAVSEQVGGPVAWADQKWEAFRTNDESGQEQSRFLSASGTGRYALWKVAYEDFASRPILGVGTYNYEATYYQLRESGVGFARQPHMLTLEVLAERGVVGAALFFGFLGTCLAAGLWKRFRNLNAEGKAQVGAVIAAFTYWFVHSSAEWFWQIPAVTMPVMVYLAILVAPWSSRETEAPRWGPRLIGAGAAALLVAAVVPLYAASYYLQRSETAESPRAALQTVERAQRLNPVDPRLPQREAELALKAGDWPRAGRAYAEAVRLNPEHYAPYKLSALFHEHRGNPEKALALYRKAFSLNPRDREIEERIERLGGQTPG